MVRFANLVWSSHCKEKPACEVSTVEFPFTIFDEFYTYKNKGYLAQWWAFNIHRIFPIHKRLFTVEKGILDFLNVLHINKNKKKRFL